MPSVCSITECKIFFHRSSEVHISGRPVFVSITLNISSRASPLLSPHCRERFLDKGRTEGKRPLSTETAVLLHGGRPNHAFRRNQVRHDACSTHAYLVCDAQFDLQFTPHIGALLFSVPTLSLKVNILLTIYLLNGLAAAVCKASSKIICLHG